MSLLVFFFLFWRNIRGRERFFMAILLIKFVYKICAYISINFEKSAEIEVLSTEIKIDDSIFFVLAMVLARI